MSCLKCEFFHSDSYSEGFWYICTHEKFGADGEILPTKDGVTPEWCPLGLAIKNTETGSTPPPAGNRRKRTTMIKRATLKDGRYVIITTRRAAYVSHIFGKASIYKSKESYDKNNVLLDGYKTITNIHLGNTKEELPAKIQEFINSIEASA